MRREGAERLARRRVQAECFGRLAYGRFWLHGADGGDQGDAVWAVGAADVLQHFVAAAAAKVEVYVGQAGAGRIEETLKSRPLATGSTVVMPRA
jgi:hypothetical protein